MKFAASLFALLLSATLAFADGAIATVDMAALIQNHPSTEENKKILGDLKEDSEKRRDEKIAALKKLRAETEEAVAQAQNEALSETARFAAKETAKSKMAQLQKDEAALRDFVDDLQKDLSRAEMERLNETVNDIQAAIDAIAKESGIALVFDASRSPIGGYSPVLYSAENLDITQAVSDRVKADRAAKKDAK